MAIGSLTVTFNTKVSWWVMPAMHAMALCNRLTGVPSLERAVDIAMRGVKVEVADQ
ncbi:hypothetical protein D3C85_1054640 [compost metagenome]